MTDLSIFINNNLYLVAIFVAVTIIYILFELFFREDASGISPQEAVSKINKGKNVLLDIRSQDTYEQGHIVGANNVSFDSADANYKKFDKFMKKNIILVCSDGRSSSKLCKVLTNKGYNSVEYVLKGISGWSEAGLPLTKGKN